MRKNKTFLYLLLLSWNLTPFCAGQSSTYRWEGKKVDSFEGFEFLIDQNYSFEEVLTDSSLTFQPFPEGYRPAQERYWWFRFAI